MHLSVQQLCVDTKRFRALSFHIFASAILLLREWQVSHDMNQREALDAALELLDRVKSRNALARHASLILRERMNSMN